MLISVFLLVESNFAVLTNSDSFPPHKVTKTQTKTTCIKLYAVDSCVYQQKTELLVDEYKEQKEKQNLNFFVLFLIF